MLTSFQTPVRQVDRFPAVIDLRPILRSLTRFASGAVATVWIAGFCSTGLAQPTQTTPSQATEPLVSDSLPSDSQATESTQLDPLTAEPLVSDSQLATEPGSNSELVQADERPVLFDSAMAQIRAGDYVDGYRALISLAPLSGPGYAPAHLQLSRFLYAQGPVNFQIAYRHVQLAGVADASGLETIEMAAEMQWAATMVVHLNTSTERNQFDEALGKFENEHERARQLLNGGENRTAEARLGFLNSLITSVYLRQASQIRQERGSVELLLENYRKVLELQPSNMSVKQHLAFMVLGDVTNADAAREIYNPFKDDDPPTPVISLVGNYHLERGEIDLARTRFAQALEKAPSNSMLLNNLAYCELQANPPNTIRALELINQAISNLESLPNRPSNFDLSHSHFHDTLGKALRKQGRLDEARQAFETALRGRPKSDELLEQLMQVKHEIANPDTDNETSVEIVSPDAGEGTENEGESSDLVPLEIPEPFPPGGNVDGVDDDADSTHDENGGLR